MKNIDSTHNVAIEKAVSIASGYGALLEQHGLHYAADNHYLICGGGQKTGDRRHYVSVVISQLENLLRLLIPELVGMGLGFGIVKDQQSARLVLNGYLGAGHVGKVVIVFVPQGREDMLRKIASITQCFFGPVVPGKVQISSCVFVDPGHDGDCFFIDQEINRKEQIAQNGDKVVYDQVPTGSKIHMQNNNDVFSNPATPGQKKNGNRLQVLDGKYVVISVLKSDPKGDVLKALYLNLYLLPTWCIIKEGRRFMVSDDAGRDMDDRLNWQADQYETLHAVVNIPKVIDLFQQDGNTYLVMERIRGRNIGKVIDEVYGRKEEKAMQNGSGDGQVQIQSTANGLIVGAGQNQVQNISGNSNKTWPTLGRKKQHYLLGLLLRIIDMIACVHERNFLHRDISTANLLLTKRNKLYLIDWELAFDEKAQYPLPPFGFGTPGFISPEQNLGDYPSVKEDIHGLCALMLVCFIGIRPVALKGEEREDVEGFLLRGTGEEGISLLIGRGMDRDRDKRPELGELREAVVALMEARR